MNDKLIMKDGKPHKIAEVVMFPTEKASNIAVNVNNNNIVLMAEYLQKHRTEGYQNQHLYFLSSEEIKEKSLLNTDDYYCIKNHYNEWYIGKFNGKSFDFINNGGNFDSDLFICKKVIATTDESLRIYYAIDYDYDKLSTHTNLEVGDKSLPRPSDDFLKAFVKAEGKITEVLVEINTEFYADSKPFATKASRDSYVQETGASHSCWTKNLGMKVSPDNTISIKPIQEEKTSWNRDEVIELLEKHSDYIDSNINYEAILSACCSIPTPSWNDDEWIKENL
mgnify:FL=1